VGTLERAVDRVRVRVERGCGLRAAVPEHVAQDQDRALLSRKVLKRRDERELDALALLVAHVGARERLDPHRLGQRLGGFGVGVGGRRLVVDRQHPLGPALDRAQADVRRDRVEP
jgi:hypothetical protein